MAVSSGLAGMSDGALMRRVARQDADAFAVVYDRFIATAYGIAFRVVGSRAPADDVCQDAFLAVWRSASKFDPALGNAKGWVLQVVRNRAIDHVRRAKRTGAREVADHIPERHRAPADLDTETAAVRNLEGERTRGLLGVLSDDQRRVVELAYFDGFSQSEIATILGVPLGTVKARTLRGLLRMRTAADRDAG